MEAALIGAAVVVAVAAALWLATGAVRRAVELRLAATETGLAQAGGELRRLADGQAWREQGAAELRRDVAAFADALEQLRVREEERRAREEQSWAVLHRVSAVLAGGQRTGRAGENVLREALADLPPSMVERDFRVNGQVVEFGIVLPDGRRLPVDSKWAADAELQALAAARDPLERDRLCGAVERAVAKRVREVAAYLDPSLTASVGVAAVPDAAYAVLRRAHGEAFRRGVVVVPYSMALPVLLFLHGLVARFGSSGDVQACIAEIAGVLDALEATLENKLEKASTMLGNGTQEIRAHLGKARTSVNRAAAARADPPAAEAPFLAAAAS